MEKCKKVTIKSLKDLVEVFPSMTICQIIRLYCHCLQKMKRVDSLIGSCTDERHINELLESLEPLCEMEAFLSGYLARCYCKLQGFDLF